MKRLEVIFLCSVIACSMFLSCAAEQIPTTHQLQLDEFIQRYNLYNIGVEATYQKKFVPLKATRKKAENNGLVPFSIKDKYALIEGYLEGERVSSFQATIKRYDTMPLCSIVAALRPEGFVAGMAQSYDFTQIYRLYESMKSSFSQVSTFMLNGYELKEIERSKNGETKKLSVTWLGN